MSKKTIVILITSILLVSVFSASLLITSFLIAYKPVMSDTTKEQTPQNESKIKEQIVQIEKSQEKFVKFYSTLQQNKTQKVESYLNLMAPLGVLDPIANPPQVHSQDDVLNFLFGVYAKKFGLGEQETLRQIASPLDHANSFDIDKYFLEVNAQLFNLVELLSNYPEIEILGFWPNQTYRINNYFGDAEYHTIWETDDTTGPFYSYKEIHTASTSAPLLERRYAMRDYGPFAQIMAALGIESLYKCNDVTILIINGVSDNAFGLLYNAQSANEINCGLFKNRFNVIYDKPLASKWRYWVAN